MNQTNLYSITVPALKKSLQSLSQMLKIAAELANSKATNWQPAEVQTASLLNDRIVFDQFPLVRQIQMACDNAKGGAGRLAQSEIPIFEDHEKTIEELQARIEKTISFLDSIKPEQIIGKEDIQVSLPYFKDKYFTGFDYATQYLLPNFYFHVTTAYAILRKNGAKVGKTDYLGDLPLHQTS
jgi:hypothetical protein